MNLNANSQLQVYVRLTGEGTHCALQAALRVPMQVRLPTQYQHQHQDFTKQINWGDDMNTKLVRVLASVCPAGALGIVTTSASAQSSEVKEKPRIYTYVSN